MIMVIGLSRSLLLTGAAMAVDGATNILTIALLNVGVQLSVPRWVAARALSWFQASLTGGIAVGAWIWGRGRRNGASSMRSSAPAPRSC